MSKFIPKPPPAGTKPIYRGDGVYVLLTRSPQRDLKDRFHRLKEQYGLSSEKLSLQMIEFCLDNLGVSPPEDKL